MRNYSSQITNRPQTQPAFGRTDMVKNNAGGYGFAISPQERLERFILIGSEGGTYYVQEQALTEQNATAIVEYIKAHGPKVIATVVDFLSNNRAPKADPGLFVLALAATYGNDETKLQAYSAINKVSRTATQLFTFVANVNNLRGWSRGLRRGVANFYLSRTADQLAYQVVKYRNRAGFTHRDVLRLAHVKTEDQNKNAVLRFAAGKTGENETVHQLIYQYELANKAGTSSSALAGIINEGKLPWEAIPTERLNDTVVLEALLEHMPMVALIRNLNRFAYNGMTDGLTKITKTIVSRLTNAEEVAKSGIHPINVVNSMLTYMRGYGDKGSKTWTANQKIVDALATTFDLAIKAIKPTGKSILIGVDISGSMRENVGGTSMSAAQVANILALTLLKSEPNAELVAFNTATKPASFGARNSLDEVLKSSVVNGGTDCAQPILYALEQSKKGVKYDSILILTDNETWAGKQHGFEALAQYRSSVNPNAKIVEVALVATPSTTMPSDDKNLLRVVGFDSSVIDLINTYLE